MKTFISFLREIAGHGKGRSRLFPHATRFTACLVLSQCCGLFPDWGAGAKAFAFENVVETSSEPPCGDLFHPDAQRRSAEIANAVDAGLISPEFRSPLRNISSSDEDVRAQLARKLSESGKSDPTSFVTSLLNSGDVKLQRIGLQLCREGLSSPSIDTSLERISASEEDFVLQAEARLLLAERPSSGVQPALLPRFEGKAIELPAGPPDLSLSSMQAEHQVVPALGERNSPSPVNLRISDSGIALASASVTEGEPRAGISKLLFAGASAIPLIRLTADDGAEEQGVARTRLIDLPGLPTLGTEEESVVPPILNRPLLTPDELFSQEAAEPLDDVLLAYAVDAPLGYTGKSGILPEDLQEDSHFVPMPDRWRSGFPSWDRYGKGHPHDDDYPFAEGSKWDPYRQNVLKGDYPFIGQHTFFRFTGQVLSLQEYRKVPVATTPFESTVNPNQEEFFGNPSQYFSTNYFKASFEIFHGNAGFKPVDWSIRLTPIFNINYLNVQELGVVKPNVRNGTTRFDDFMALEEYFIEAKLADLSPDYDFVSARIGSQPFTSDFRGFIFSDINRAVRLFGTRLANRDEFNLIFFDQTEKDTNSQLNTFRDRHQNTLIANYYRQDFIFPGYSAELSFHYNRDGPSMEYDTNGFLVRPDPAGVALPHQVDACYFGFAGEGHIGRINVSNALYWAVGQDSINPIAGQKQDINAQMAALELSYDRDWIRFRASYFFASGDDNAYDKQATGFDTIFDNPNFAGGEFSYWQRQQIQLFGVSLTNRNSLVPDLRSSKFQGQSNFVNPGLHILNLGMDFELTPKLRLITNANYLEFDKTGALEAFVYQGGIDKTIGVDLSAGLEYRPFLNDNVIFEGGYAALIPGRGFDDLYGKTEPFTTANATNFKSPTLHQVFMQMALTY